MFTGLVQTHSTVLEKSKAEGGYKLALSKPEAFNDLKIGESIAVNGICLTLENYDESKLGFFVGMETLAKTDFLTWRINHDVNLEQSLRMSDRLGGHMVSGHVDGTALVTVATPEGEGMHLEIQVKPEHVKWIIPKGSLTINGVSLTVNEFDKERLSFFLIPETLKMTNLKNLSPGDFVNIECDSFVKVIIEKLGEKFGNQFTEKLSQKIEGMSL